MTGDLRAITLIDAMAAGTDLLDEPAPGLITIRRLGYLPYARLRVRQRDVLIAIYRPGARRDALLRTARAADLGSAIREARVLLREVCLGEVARQ